MDQMPLEKKARKNLTAQLGAGSPSRKPWILAVLVLIVAGVGLYFLVSSQPQKPPEPAQALQKAAQAQSKTAQHTGTPGGAPAPPAPSKTGEVVTIMPEGGDAASQQEQALRKKPYGLDKSLDVVVRSDEVLKVDGKIVPMSEMERKLVVEQRGEMLDSPLGKPRRISAWGVHMVRPGENLWGIHFHLLSEFLASRGVTLQKTSDQPMPNGRSTGVGKILKFAEHMVGVYNVKTGHMSDDLNQLEPGVKMVIFNLSEIFEQLAKIDPKDLSGVMYDGRVLLFPQPKGKATIVQAPAVGTNSNKE